MPASRFLALLSQALEQFLGCFLAPLSRALEQFLGPAVPGIKAGVIADACALV